MKHFRDSSPVGGGTILCDADGSCGPVFALNYSECRYKKLLAIGDENGYISILDTKKKLTGMLSDRGSTLRPLAQWRPHTNALFDLKWAHEDLWMYSASGDMTIGQWDTGYASRIATLGGHEASVKALAVAPSNTHVLASGGRDGHLMLWDVRVKESCGFEGMDGDPRALRPVMVKQDAHKLTKHGRARRRGKNPRMTSKGSVTSLCFLPENSEFILASGGTDGCLKLWDVRYLASPAQQNELSVATPLQDREAAISATLIKQNMDYKSLENISCGNQPLLCARDRAITSLALHPTGSLIMASYLGGHHLLYNVSHIDAGPIQWFGGNSISSFYVKSSFSPDGTHFLSGSSDAKAYIWNLHDASGAEPYTLEGHTKEVTSVAWCSTDALQIATAGDDCLVKVWNVDVRQEAEKKQVVSKRGLYGSSPGSKWHKPDQMEKGSVPVQTPPATMSRPTMDRSPQLSVSPPSPPSSKIRIGDALAKISSDQRLKRKRQQTLEDVMRARQTF